MLWLILSILSSTGIYVVFKFVDKAKLNLLNIIIINYLIAAASGFMLAGRFPVNEIISADWLFVGIVLGILLIVLFFMVGMSSAKAGISITTVSCKMAVVIPMVFSIIVFSENAGAIKILSIFLALAAVIMSVYKKNTTEVKFNMLSMILPLTLFLGMGMENSLLIFSKEKYINADTSSVYTATLFSIALLSGLLVLTVRYKMIMIFKNPKIWLAGTMLGLANFGSIYFVLRALNSGVFANSVVYGITNIGIVTLSVLIGTMFFKEKLSKLNVCGVFISILTIVLLTYADAV